jgi:beta-lactamase family protein
MPTQIDAAAVDQFLSRELTAASIPGAAVAITRGDQVLHVRGYGHDSHHVPVTDRTLFRIASLSKSFTSLAVLQLVDAGRVSLDDSVPSTCLSFDRRIRGVPTSPCGSSSTRHQGWLTGAMRLQAE